MFLNFALLCKKVLILPNSKSSVELLWDSETNMVIDLDLRYVFRLYRNQNRKFRIICRYLCAYLQYTKNYIFCNERKHGRSPPDRLPPPNDQILMSCIHVSGDRPLGKLKMWIDFDSKGMNHVIVESTSAARYGSHFILILYINTLTHIAHVKCSWKLMVVSTIQVMIMGLWPVDQYALIQGVLYWDEAKIHCETKIL